MSYIKKNEGYALVLVLFLVVFIMTITAVFMRGSISNAKQEKIVDSNNLSYVAAEMGVDYYNTKFTNKFLLERNKIWNEEFTNYKNEVTSEEYKGDPVATANYYQKIIRNRIINKLQEVNSTSSPADAYFRGKGEKFSVCVPATLCESNNAIIVKGNVIGKYETGKEAELAISLLFEVPDLVLSIDDENSNDGDSGVKSEKLFNPFTKYKLIEQTIEELKSVIIAQETSYKQDENIDNKSNVSISRKDSVQLGKFQGNSSVSISTENQAKTTEIYGNENVDIKANGKVETGKIQDNKNNLKISSKEKIQIKGNLYNNKDVVIKTNGEFQTDGEISQNDGTLTILSTDKFKSGMIVGNERVKILTNGEFQSDSIDGNKFSLDIQSSNKFQSGKITGNAVTNIQTNGEFQSGLIEQNNSGLTIKSKDGFQSGNLQYNTNVSVETFGSFQANIIIGNKEKIVLKSIGKFQANEQIQDNNNMEILTNNSFQAKELYGNKTIKVYSEDKFHIDNKIQDNHNLLILTNGEFETGGVIYGNKGIEIHSKGKFQTKNIQDNTNLKIVAYKDFQADNIYLQDNSMICVGGQYQANHLSTSGNSAVYVRKKEYAKSSNIKYLEKEEWETKCGASFNDTDIEIPTLNENVIWNKPELKVEY